MSSEEIRRKFLEFFEKRGHKIVPSSSLVPENDSSVLFTSAGMQQFKPYYLGKKDAKKDFGSLNVASIQKCVRTSDIEEVGDETHLTFFEMLGNFSFGGYWKKEAIRYAYEFITGEIGLEIGYVTVFKGDKGTPADEESEEVWKSIDQKIEIRRSGREDNFWGPTGEEGPCGPTTEIYINGVEIWNIVFNEYYQGKDGTLSPLETKGVDTGMGLERLLVQVQKVSNVFETDLFPSHPEDRVGRVMADHTRAIKMMLEENLVPSNKDQGYVLRRLMRRVLFYAKKYNLSVAIDSSVFKEEQYKFDKTLDEAMKKFNEHMEEYFNGKYEGNELPPSIVFELVTSDGLPFELVLEEARDRGKEVDEAEFKNRLEAHRIKSRKGTEQKFKGGLAGHSEMEIKYHTATHLLHQALREVLGKDVFQKGSNITPERLRFDFSFPRKMTPEETTKVENLVNAQIKASLPVSYEDLSLEEAQKMGAIGLFEEKYTDKVRVYKVGEFSLEFCGGPHVENTKTLGLFKIKKEEAVSRGVRRIKAVLE